MSQCHDYVTPGMWGGGGVLHFFLFNTVHFSTLVSKGLGHSSGRAGFGGGDLEDCGTGPGDYFSVICNNIDTRIVIVVDIVHVTVLSQ